MSEIWNKCTTDWSYHVEQVMKFNNLCGNDLKDHTVLVELYRKLCIEESEEALAAFNLEDMQGNSISEGQALNDLVDAACDLFYVGTYYSYLNIGSTPFRNYRSLCRTMEKLQIWCSNPTAFEEHDVPYDISISLLNILEVNTSEALNKVHESNLSKFIDVTGIPLEDINEIAETEVEEIKQGYKAKGKALKEVTYQVNPYGDEHWLTFYNENGKVLKPSGFFEPDFTDIIKHLL